jgi:hypothetical protein
VNWPGRKKRIQRFLAILQRAIESRLGLQNRRAADHRAELLVRMMLTSVLIPRKVKDANPSGRFCQLQRPELCPRAFTIPPLGTSTRGLQSSGQLNVFSKTLLVARRPVANAGDFVAARVARVGRLVVRGHRRRVARIL